MFKKYFIRSLKKYLQINNNCILILITIGNVYIDECKNIYNFINVKINSKGCCDTTKSTQSRNELTLYHKL